MFLTLNLEARGAISRPQKAPLLPIAVELKTEGLELSFGIQPNLGVKIFRKG